MCLACEMDALWFAEMEAAARVTPGSAGVPPTLSDAANAAPPPYGTGVGGEPRDAYLLERPAPQPLPLPTRGEGVHAAPPLHNPAPLRVKSPFTCEETRSQ